MRVMTFWDHLPRLREPAACMLRTRIMLGDAERVGWVDDEAFRYSGSGVTQITFFGHCGRSATIDRPLFCVYYNSKTRPTLPRTLLL